NHTVYLATARERSRFARVRSRTNHRSDHQPYADRIMAGPEAPRRGLANDHNRGLRFGLLDGKPTPADHGDPERLEIIPRNIAVASRRSFVFASLTGWWLCVVNHNRHKPVAAGNRRA